MSENPFEILRDWAQEPENIETIAQAVQALQRSVTQLTATLSSVVTVNSSGSSASSASSGVSSSGTLTPMPTNLGDIWIVGPNPTDQTIVLRYAGEPDEPITLSTTLQTFLVGMLVLFINGPAAGYPTVVTDVASDGTITVEPLDHTPNPGNRFVFLSSFAATSGSQYNPNHQGTLPPSGNNTVTIPSGVTVNMDIPGQFANNTITVNANGTGLVTTIKANSMVGSNINVDEGDTVHVGMMAESSIVSRNNAGGLTATVNPGNANISFSDPNTPSGNFTVTSTYGGSSATYVYVYLQAGSPCTFTLNCTSGSVYADGWWSIDNGPETTWNNGGPNHLFTDIPLLVGDHVMTIYLSGGLPFYAQYANFTFADCSTGYITEKLTSPSYFYANNMSNAGAILDGDTVTITGNDVMNSQIENQSGGTVQGSQITVEGSIVASNIFYSSVVDIILGNLMDATITVPSGVDVTTIIQYTGTISEDLTTTAARTVYVGTDLIAGYTPPSSDPASVVPTTVQAADVLYVPNGNTAAYTTLTDNGFVRVAGRLITETVVIGPGAQLVVDAGGQVELGAFS